MAQIDIGSLVLKIGGVAYSWSRETSRRKESIGEWRGSLGRMERKSQESSKNRL